MPVIQIIYILNSGHHFISLVGNENGWINENRADK